MSSSRRYIQKHKQYTESNLMQYALSYLDAGFDLAQGHTVRGSQNLTHLIFSISLGRFYKRLRTTGLLHLIVKSGYFGRIRYIVSYCIF